MRSDKGVSDSNMSDQGEEPVIAEEDYYTRGMQVVLHEDKQYFPEAAEVFGKDVEALVEEEDHQPLTQPIIEPPKTKFHTVMTTKVPALKYSVEYMA